MGKRLAIISILVFGILTIIIAYNRFFKSLPKTVFPNGKNEEVLQGGNGGLINESNPLSIEYMRKQEYPGSDIVIEQTLPSGSNYDRYIASYKSDGLKIYALLTIPQGEKPENGWPVIIFNHGYIPPAEYQTTERYLAYTDAFSRNGYVVFKPDYRGHGNSEGNPEGAYYSPVYTIDVLNAVSSIKRYPQVNPNKIGMWGHSLGGNLTLRSMVVSQDIRVGVIWAGVVGTYEELMAKWGRRNSSAPSQSRIQEHVSSIRQNLLDRYGSLQENPQFWRSIDPRYFFAEILTPIQLHHGTADEEVPLLFSESLKNNLEKAGKVVELYTYEGDDHNLSNSFDLALQRSVDFFDRYLK